MLGTSLSFVLGPKTRFVRPGFCPPIDFERVSIVYSQKPDYPLLSGYWDSSVTKQGGQTSSWTQTPVFYGILRPTIATLLRLRTERSCVDSCRGEQWVKGWAFSGRTSFQTRIETFVARVFSPQVPLKPRLRRVSISVVSGNTQQACQQKNEKRALANNPSYYSTSLKLVCCQISW